MNTEQERADFEAWAADIAELHTMPSGEYSSRITRFAWEAYQAGRATLKPQKPEPNDVMLSGVLRMPFNMAMATEMSRVQFYHRAQQALDELEALQSQDRADAERYRWLRDPCSGAEHVIFYSRGDYGKGLMSGEMLDEAIDHARRIEGDGE